MFGHVNMKKAEATFSWLHFCGINWILPTARVIIEKTDSDAVVFLLPTSFKNTPPLNNTSDDELSSLRDLLDAQVITYYKNKNVPSLIDEPLRTVLKQYGLSRTLSENEWTDFLHMLFSEVKIQNWEERYDNPRIYDGYGWVIEYRYKNTVRHISGSNAYPESWKTLITHLRKLTSFSGVTI